MNPMLPVWRRSRVPTLVYPATVSMANKWALAGGEGLCVLSNGNPWKVLHKILISRAS